MVVGALFMDVKLAFNNVSKAYLGRRMEALELEQDPIWWAYSIMTSNSCSVER